MRLVAILAVGMMLTACSQSIKTVNTYKVLTGGSYHGAGLEERVLNCAKDIFDPANRGSTCN